MESIFGCLRTTLAWNRDVTGSLDRLDLYQRRPPRGAALEEEKRPSGDLLSIPSVDGKGVKEKD